MGYYADKKDYYESETQRRVLHIPNLSLFLSKLNDQVLKLPHEIVDNSVARPTGCTEEDIIHSITRGVRIAYSMAAPARAMLATEEGKLREFEPADQKKYDALNEFDKAMEKLDWLYLLLEEADWLNDRLVSDSLPGDEETYDYGGKTNETTDERSMPASVPVADDKTLGPVEEENKQGVA
jgi:hypothetical protein